MCHAFCSPPGMTNEQLAQRLRQRGGRCRSLHWCAESLRWSKSTDWQVKRTLLDYYCRAVRFQEEKKMPEVGYSMDRRSLRHVSTHCADGRVHSLICFMCAQVFTCCTGVGEAAAECEQEPDDAWKHRWYPPAEKQTSEIGYFSVRQSLLTWYKVHKPSFMEHLSPSQYRGRYCEEQSVDVQFPELHEDNDNWEWKRRLRLDDVRQPHLLLLCCPEDLRACGGRHLPGEICGRCSVPLCSRCAGQFLWSGSQIQMRTR